jgi:cytochrome c biogenesis protein CcmG, thiol:disulfide interchange protein DsbE
MSTPDTNDTRSSVVRAASAKPSLLRFAPLAIFAVIAGVFAFALRTGDPSKLPSALLGKDAPRLTLPPIEGLALPGLSEGALADGKPVVVNFWASWCAPCVAEHPLLVELGRQTGVRLVGINHKDTATNARRFLGRYGNPFASVGVDANGRASIEWGVYGMPETFVLDGKGRIVFKHVGPISEETLRRDIVPAIARAAKL